MEEEKINFNVVRDFSELFNASAKFFNKNFKHFFQSVIFIAGPLILMASISMAIYQYSMFGTPPIARGSFESAAEYSSLLFQRMGWGYALYLFFSIISNLVLITTVYSYMIVYSEHGPRNFGVAEVRKEMMKNITKTVKGFFAMIFLFLAICIVLGIVAAMFGTGIRVLLGFMLLLALLFSPPLIWQVSTFYLVQMKEDVPFFEAFRRTKEVMRGNFFSTWLYMFATFITLFIVFIAFSLPQIILGIAIGVGHFESSFTAVVMGITMITKFFIILVYSIFYFMCGLHYYSLAEKKDGTSLSSRIDEIGNAPAPDVEQHY